MSTDSHKRCLEDETPIEFIAQVDEDAKLYSLVITCKLPLTEEQYARCLISFAKDILEGQFSFDSVHNFDNTSQ